MRERLRAFVEDLLPWYDREQATRHDEATERIRLRSIRARQVSERIRDLSPTSDNAQLAIALRHTAKALRGQR